MCGSMVDIQSPTAEIRQGKKKIRRKKQDENIMVCPIPYGDHKNTTFTLNLHEFLRTMYKYMLNLVVKISLMFAQYFEYYGIILRGGVFSWTHY